MWVPITSQHPGIPIKPLEPALTFLTAEQRSGAGCSAVPRDRRRAGRLLKWCWPCDTAGQTIAAIAGQPFPSVERILLGG